MLNAFKLYTRFNSTLSKISSLQFLSPKSNENIKVQGWIQNIRKMKKYIFIDINDGSVANLQIVVDKENLETAGVIGIGCSIRASGKIKESPSGHIELRADNLVVLANCNIVDGYPFTPKQEHRPEYAREYLHLRSRIDYMSSIFRIRHKATKIIHDYMDENEFVHIHTPILTTNDCEGAGETFVVKSESTKLPKSMKQTEDPLPKSFFDREVFLTVSGQLHLEAMSYGLGSTYTFSPAFRAENSKSSLHLSEFYMLEAELTYTNELQQLINFIETMIKAITETVLIKCHEDLKFLQKFNADDTNLTKIDWLQKNWVRLEYSEAHKILKQNENVVFSKGRENEGFSKEQELFLTKYFQSPVFIVNWPTNMKPFYMKINPNDNSKVEALDLIMPEVGELAGGSLRENDVNRLKQRIPNGLDWYLDLRKYGSIPTGGFGLGFERYLKLITKIKNIRDVIPFPRYAHSCKM